MKVNGKITLRQVGKSLVTGYPGKELQVHDCPIFGGSIGYH
jgi:hypothetical protein